jgi:uncharacterized protein
MKAHFILFVSDQQSSTSFYSHVLASEPSLNVPGMTEFDLGGGAVLGLMPTTGAANLLGSVVTSGGASPPRTETYIVVDDAGAFHGRAVAAGGREISPLSKRDWGHSAAYCLDPDGHIIAFAEITNG